MPHTYVDARIISPSTMAEVSASYGDWMTVHGPAAADALARLARADGNARIMVTEHSHGEGIECPALVTVGGDDAIESGACYLWCRELVRAANGALALVR